MQSISHVLKALRPLSAFASPLSRAYGGVKSSFSRGNPIVDSYSSADVALSERPKARPKVMLKNAETTSWLNSPSMASKQNVPPIPHRAGGNDIDAERTSSSKPMDFVREVLQQSGSHLSHHRAEQCADIVHINIKRNNTFVTVTDYKGNKIEGIPPKPNSKQIYGRSKRPSSKTGFVHLVDYKKDMAEEPQAISGSLGQVPELMDGPKNSRYTAEATAEHYGRLAREKGLKSVVMKVRGFTYFKKKRQAIMSFKDGFTGSQSDWNPILSIEDKTRRPHNGCRLPKRRRI